MKSSIEEFLKRNQYEQQLYDQNVQFIAGIDEVGRGPLAGPVVCAAVILDPLVPIYGLKDSKKLSKKRIKELASIIKTQSLSYAIVSVSANTIDKIGIRKAVHLGMRRCIYKLNIKPQHILIDYELLNFKNIPSQAIVRGDDASNSIAAASILAKDYRDTLMKKIGEKYPEYGFDTNAGYGTKVHLQAIDKNGPIKDVHRFTFKPISNLKEINEHI